MQKIIINGNVGKNPEERFTKNGQKVTINTVEFIGSKKDEQQADSEPESTAQSAFNAPGPSLQSDDVPF